MSGSGCALRRRCCDHYVWAACGRLCESVSREPLYPVEHRLISKRSEPAPIDNLDRKVAVSSTGFVVRFAQGTARPSRLRHPGRPPMRLDGRRILASPRAGKLPILAFGSNCFLSFGRPFHCDTARNSGQIRGYFSHFQPCFAENAACCVGLARSNLDEPQSLGPQ